MALSTITSTLVYQEWKGHPPRPIEAPETDAKGDGGSEGEQEMPSRSNLTVLQHSAPRAPGRAVLHHLQAEEASRCAGHQLSLFPKAPL